MASNKKELFDPSQVKLATFAGALAHPARIAIVIFLQEHKEACCGEIVAALPLAQATVSQHLRALREADLLITRNCGPKVCYSLNCESIRSFCHNFQCTLGTDEKPNEASSPRAEIHTSNT